MDVEIESIGGGGDGVARSEGLVVFVPRSAPGDAGRVRARPARGGRFARGVWDVIERGGAARIEPPCAHYVVDRCGGCQLQHISYGGQLEAKGGIVRDAMERIARRKATAPQVVASPKEWRYRRKLTLAMRRRAGGDWIAGLHPYDAPGEVFDLRDCPITDQGVLAVWAEIRGAAEWLPDSAELRGAVRITDAGEAAGASFVVEGGASWPRYEKFFAAVPSLASLWWQPEKGSARRLRHRDDVADPGASFAQVNAEVASLVREHVLKLAMAHAPSTAIDAYSGRGDMAVDLAARGVSVTAIELDREGARAASERLDPPSRSFVGRVEEALPTLLPVDLVILNPPRGGLDERVTAALQGTPSAQGPSELQATPLPARALIYVSCDPATLARDLARLPGWRIASIRSFDMFPQTAHVETVCELVPEES